MIIILNKLENYLHFKVNSSTIVNKWYDVYFLDGNYLCLCSIEYKRNNKIICKHIQEVLDNSKYYDSKCDIYIDIAKECNLEFIDMSLIEEE